MACENEPLLKDPGTWRYDDDGYICCPDCCLSMSSGQENETRNHAPDCNYFSTTKQDVFQMKRNDNGL